MRRMLRILKWLGLGLSTILFVGTGVLWVRSLGHHETWALCDFTSMPDRGHEILRGWGRLRVRRVEAIHGRLWLGSGTEALDSKFELGALHKRRPITADEASVKFETMFQPGQRPWRDGVERAWRFGGVGFWQGATAVDPRIGQPQAWGFTLAIPFWLLAAFFGLWPVCFVARQVLRRRKYGPGQCPSCGYDLRATPDPTGPLLPGCPECGRVSPESAGAGQRAS